MTDTEYAELLRDLARVVQPRAALPPDRGRQRRLPCGVAVPDPAATGPES